MSHKSYSCSCHSLCVMRIHDTFFAFFILPLFFLLAGLFFKELARWSYMKRFLPAAGSPLQIARSHWRL